MIIVKLYYIFCLVGDNIIVEDLKVLGNSVTYFC